MLPYSFCHLPRIGLKTEKRIWDSGILTWADFLARGHRFFPLKDYRRLYTFIQKSQSELEKGNAAYFASNLPKNEVWRLFSSFQSSVAYIDIETTGMGGGLDHITTIALYDGQSIRTYVHGLNLEDFADDILRYQLVVTFNGSCFDLPFLEKELGMARPKAHIDLRFLLRGLGFKGGLKVCEKNFGLDRGSLQGVDGYFAVLLWQEFLSSGDEKVLETLLAYNVEDVLNLEALMVEAFNQKLSNIPFSHLSLQAPFTLPNPYEAHPYVLDAVRRKKPGL